jgi:hypothetical protein
VIVFQGEALEWHEKPLLDQIKLKWYAMHTHRRTGPCDVWTDCRLISDKHPLYGKFKGNGATCQTPDEGVNHVCTKRLEGGGLCLAEFRLQLKKAKNGDTPSAWDRGATFHSSIVHSHNESKHKILSTGRKAAKLKRVRAVIDNFDDSDDGATGDTEESEPEKNKAPRNANQVPSVKPHGGPMDNYVKSIRKSIDKVRGKQKMGQMLWYVYGENLVSASAFNGAEFRKMLQAGV